MKTKINGGRISGRMILISAIMLAAVSANANTTLETALSVTRESLIIFYVIGGMFVAGLLIHFMGNRFLKGKSERILRPATRMSAGRRQNYHYRRVVKKTA